MSAGHTHLELAGSELTAGILTGLAMCAVLQSAVLYQNFKPWFKKPNLTPMPSPELFLGAAIHSFVAMVFTSALLTFTFYRYNPDEGATKLGSGNIEIDNGKIKIGLKNRS